MERKYSSPVSPKWIPPLHWIHCLLRLSCACKIRQREQRRSYGALLLELSTCSFPHALFVREKSCNGEIHLLLWAAPWLPKQRQKAARCQKCLLPQLPTPIFRYSHHSPLSLWDSKCLSLKMHTCLKFRMFLHYIFFLFCAGFSL